MRMDLKVIENQTESQWQWNRFSLRMKLKVNENETDCHWESHLIKLLLTSKRGQLQNRSSLCFVRSKSQWKENTWTFTQRKRRRFATRYVLSRRKRIRTMLDAPWRSHWEYPKPRTTLTHRSYGDDTKKRWKMQIWEFKKMWNEGEMGRFWGQKAGCFAGKLSLLCTSM